jgi:hypothetical protein
LLDNKQKYPSFACDRFAFLSVTKYNVAKALYKNNIYNREIKYDGVFKRNIGNVGSLLRYLHVDLTTMAL